VRHATKGDRSGSGTTTGEAGVRLGRRRGAPGAEPLGCSTRGDRRAGDVLVPPPGPGGWVALRRCRGSPLVYLLPLGAARPGGV
jgi:hypothetical protein